MFCIEDRCTHLDTIDPDPRAATITRCHGRVLQTRWRWKRRTGKRKCDQYMGSVRIHILDSGFSSHAAGSGAKFASFHCSGKREGSPMRRLGRCGELRAFDGRLILHGRSGVVLPCGRSGRDGALAGMMGRKPGLLPRSQLLLEWKWVPLREAENARVRGMPILVISLPRSSHARPFIMLHPVRIRELEDFLGLPGGVARVIPNARARVRSFRPR